MTGTDLALTEKQYKVLIDVYQRKIQGLRTRSTDLKDVQNARRLVKIGLISLENGIIDLTTEGDRIAAEAIQSPFFVYPKTRLWYWETATGMDTQGQQSKLINVARPRKKS